MAFATTPQRALGIEVETVSGTQNASPALQGIEVVNFVGDMNPAILVDNSINPNRQLMSLPERGNSPIEGTIDVVFGPTQYLPLIESLMSKAAVSGVVKFGNTTRTLTVEDKFSDATLLRVFNGVKVTSMKMSAPAGNSYATAQFGFKATAMSDFSGTSIDGSGYAAIPTTTKFYHNGGTLTEGGVALGYGTNIEVEITDNSNDVFVWGSNDPYGVVAGKIDVKVKLSALFTSNALFTKFYNSTATSLEVLMYGGASTVNLELPSMVWTKATFRNNDNGPVELDLEGTASYDVTAASTAVWTFA